MSIELVRFIDGLEASFQPGDAWEYSNTNYVLLGMVVEAATNNNIAQEIRDRILEPLALNNTFFAEEETLPGGYVRRYWDFDQDGTLNGISRANRSWAWGFWVWGEERGENSLPISPTSPFVKNLHKRFTSRKI